MISIGFHIIGEVTMFGAIDQYVMEHKDKNQTSIERYDDIILMQFTGKKAQGIDVYENDIIEFDKKEWGGEGNIHLVTWDEKKSEWSWGGGCTSDMEFRKVIGNKFENPELLQR